MFILKKILAVILAVYYAITGISFIVDKSNDYTFNIDTGSLNGEISNLASNINLWEMGTAFYNPQRNTENDVFEFVEYVQLMQCTGGNETRDLFKDPYDTTVLDDYDFTRLIKNCEGIISLGAKPMLKLGSVPMKFTSNYRFEGFGTNVLPPDNYGAYYNYIYALADELVKTFGKEEVLKWRFGVMTEYENGDWFIAQSGGPQDSAEEFCKLYDYTVDALQKAIGENVYVGAHSMSVTEGLWDEDIFIRHCAQGKNYKTGATGTRICYLSASYYVSAPEEKLEKGRKTLTKTINDLRASAEKYGLYDLNYGVDEGRVLCGNTKGTVCNELVSRSVGYTWQAAFDAKMYGEMIDTNMEYFSYWSALSGGFMNGNPTVSYHVSKNISAFKNSEKATVKKVKGGLIPKAEVKTYAGYNKEENAVHIMTYNFKNKLDYSRSADVKLNMNVPQFADGEATVTAYLINDDCNFFDEWLEDRKKYGIDDSCFSWSPDDGNIEGPLNDPEAKKLYKSELEQKYKECSALKPVTSTVQVKDGKFTLDAKLGGNNVIFYTVTQ